MSNQGTDIVSLIRPILPHGRHALHFSGKNALIAYSAARQRGEYSNDYNERNWKPDYCYLLPNSLRKWKRNDWQKEKGLQAECYQSDLSLPSLPEEAEEKRARDVNATDLISICENESIHATVDDNGKYCEKGRDFLGITA